MSNLSFFHFFDFSNQFLEYLFHSFQGSILFLDESKSPLFMGQKMTAVSPDWNQILGLFLGFIWPFLQLWTIMIKGHMSQGFSRSFSSLYLLVCNIAQKQQKKKVFSQLPTTSKIGPQKLIVAVDCYTCDTRLWTYTMALTNSSKESTDSFQKKFTKFYNIS